MEAFFGRRDGRRRTLQHGVAVTASLVALGLPGGLLAQTAIACVYTSRLIAVEAAPDGLLLRISGEPAPEVLREGTARSLAGEASVTEAAVGLLGTERAGAADISFAEDAVIRVRSVPYRRGSECGTKVYIEMRRSLPIRFERRPEGLFLRTSAPRTAPTAGQRSSSGSPGAPGGLQASGSFSSSRYGESSSRYGFAGVGFFQEVRNTGWLRGFLTSYFPTGSGGGVYGGLGLFGLPAGRQRVDMTVGDVSVSYADPTAGGSFFPGGILIRGAAVGLRRAGSFRLATFYGRAATPDAARIAAGEGTVSEISPDTVTGLFGQFGIGRLSLGGGWIRSIVSGGGGHDNLFQSASFTFAEGITLGTSVEESISTRTGWQLTVVPQVKTSRFSVSGYGRYSSAGYTAPLGASYFAGLTRSYQLSAGVALAPGVTVNAAAGQTRSFNLAEARDVGTTADSLNAGVQASVLRRLSTGAFVTSTGTRTDEGAVNPANSRTTAIGATLGTSVGNVGVTGAFSREETSDLSDPSLDFRSDRLRLDVKAGLPAAIRLAARASAADSRRLSGESAGPNYSYSLSLDRTLGRGVTAGIHAGQDVYPAGVATFGSRSTEGGGQVGWYSSSGLSVAGSLAYNRLETEGVPPTSGLYFSLNVSKGFRWGRGTGPSVSAGTRAQDFGAEIADVPITGQLVLHSFRDANGNGRSDAGEEGLAAIEIQIDTDRFTTDRKGLVKARVKPGRHRVRLDLLKVPPRLSRSFEADQTVEVFAHQRFVLELPFVVGGRVEGRVILTGSRSARPPRSSSALTSLTLRLKGPGGFQRETYTGESGGFDFLGVPEGSYELELVAEGIGPDEAVEESNVKTIQMAAGRVAQPVFLLRRKSARERFAAPAEKSTPAAPAIVQLPPPEPSVPQPAAPAMAERPTTPLPVTRPAPPAPVLAAPKDRPTPSDGPERPRTRYAIQVSSCSTRESAEAEVPRMREKLRPVRIVRADLGPRGVWYRVLVGDFADRSAAEDGRKKLEGSGVIVGPIIQIEVEP